MSTWLEVKSKDDVFIDNNQQSELEKTFKVKKQKPELCIVYSRDDFGANYVSVPLDWVKERIKDNEE